MNDYWIVNLLDGGLGAHREPTPDADAPHGWAHAMVEVLARGESIAPLAASESRIAVSTLVS